MPKTSKNQPNPEKPENSFARTLQEYRARFCKPERHTHGASESEMLACVLAREAAQRAKFASAIQGDREGATA